MRQLQTEKLELHTSSYLKSEWPSCSLLEGATSLRHQRQTLIDRLLHRAHLASVETARLWRHGCRCTRQVCRLDQCVSPGCTCIPVVHSIQICKVKVKPLELNIN
jgi:hypothetical protein